METQYRVLMIFYSRLEKREKDNQTILQRFRAMKAASDRKGIIVQVNIVFTERVTCKMPSIFMPLNTW